jgi:hypothetical protein
MHIFKGTLEHDPLAERELKMFFTEYVEKFCDDSIIKDGVVSALTSNPHGHRSCEDNMSRRRYSNQTEGFDLLREIGLFTQEYLSTTVDINRYTNIYLKTEWSTVSDLGDNQYSVSQYNAMLLSSVLKHIIKTFVRAQLYAIYGDIKDEAMRKEGTGAYITSMEEISRFGVSDPNPRFVGQKDDPMYLSTRQPDIEVLYDLFTKYGIIQFVDGVDGYRYSRYKGYSPSRMLVILSELKYTHLNVGNKGRTFLNIKTKMMNHLPEMPQEKVTGYYKWG